MKNLIKFKYFTFHTESERNTGYPSIQRGEKDG